ncbi:MAG TPA: SsrA-binding protein SmpB [Opitutaceae bacterium]|nr:SsrA-binding protein SmpB [Opitutaceae bacterium]
MAAQEKGPPRLSEIRNAKVFRDFEVGDRFEAGIQLRGTEVKSIRTGRAQISDVFCRVEKAEVWMHGAHIEPYAFGNMQNHDAKRVRKLLLHRRDIRKIALAMDAGGKALIPLRMYFKGSLVKVEVALCTGRKRFDKREDLKKKAQMREVNRALRERRG